jgi:addiction module HigA family antidote
MRMFNPPHPGEILSELWLEPLDLSISQAAKYLNVPPETLSELVNGKITMTPEMSVRLELMFDKSAESWLAAQAAYDVWQLEAKRESLGVYKLAA